MLDGKILRLHAPKITDAPPVTEPIWIRRDSWRFEWVPARYTSAEEREKAALEALRRFVTEETAGGGRPTERTLRNAVKELPGNWTRAKLENRLDRALEKGVLVWVDLPENERRGQKKRYLQAGQMP